jgi:hypothetical protein
LDVRNGLLYGAEPIFDNTEKGTAQVHNPLCPLNQR